MVLQINSTVLICFIVYIFSCVNDHEYESCASSIICHRHILYFNSFGNLIVIGKLGIIVCQLISAYGHLSAVVLYNHPRFVDRLSHVIRLIPGTTA